MVQTGKNQARSGGKTSQPNSFSLSRVNWAVIVLKDDSFLLGPTTFAVDSWSNFIFEDLEIVVAIDSSLIFKKIKIDWTLWAPEDGWHNFSDG